MVRERLTFEMKNLSLLVWLTQLGMSVALPIGGFVLIAVWLQRHFDLGSWIIFCGVFLGIFCAVDGVKTAFRSIRHLAKSKREDPPVSFNDHD